jgi:UDP-2,3-diacylglucosamine hydrolase
VYTLFISDLHLEPERPEITRLFCNFLQRHAVQADALYILGDFFATWIGEDDSSDFKKFIIKQLQTLTRQGIAVYFMHGNRDFLIGKQFLAQTGCRFLSDPTVIQLYGVPTLLMHGDTLCTDDSNYLRFRRVARNPLLQRLFLRLPLSWRQKIAQGLRKSSSKQLIDATPTEIARVIKRYDVLLLIHGHTHRPAIHYFNLDQQRVCRIVLGDWDDTTGSVLICRPNGQQRLLPFALSGELNG